MTPLVDGAIDLLISLFFQHRELLILENWPMRSCLGNISNSDINLRSPTPRCPPLHIKQDFLLLLFLTFPFLTLTVLFSPTQASNNERLSRCSSCRPLYYRELEASSSYSRDLAKQQPLQISPFDTKAMPTSLLYDRVSSKGKINTHEPTPPHRPTSNRRSTIARRGSPQ